MLFKGFSIFVRPFLLVTAAALTASCGQSPSAAPRSDAGSTATTTTTASPTTVPKASKALEFADLDGIVHRPLAVDSGKRGSVVLFVATECPISNAYAPEIGRMCEAYQQKGFDFYVVYSDPDLTDDVVRTHVKDYGYTCPAIIDRDHKLARAVGATVTPEAAIIGPASGTIAYLGRIDNLYVALGNRRFEATTHELRDAMDALLRGESIKESRTTAIGCSIPFDAKPPESKS